MRLVSQLLNATVKVWRFDPSDGYGIPNMPQSGAVVRLFQDVAI
jgi:hypothetical protein